MIGVGYGYDMDMDIIGVGYGYDMDMIEIILWNKKNYILPIHTGTNIVAPSYRCSIYLLDYGV